MKSAPFRARFGRPGPRPCRCGEVFPHPRRRASPPMQHDHLQTHACGLRVEDGEKALESPRPEPVPSIVIPGAALILMTGAAIVQFITARRGG
jgi:hypothetical protein